MPEAVMCTIYFIVTGATRAGINIQSIDLVSMVQLVCNYTRNASYASRTPTVPERHFKRIRSHYYYS